VVCCWWSAVPLAMASSATESGGGNADFKGLLHCAAQAGDAEQTRQLLQEGKVSVHEREGPFGYTALHVAAGYSSLGVAGALLAARASTSWRDTTGETPLHVAAQQGHASAIRLLLAGRADLAAINEDGESALHVAVGHVGGKSIDHIKVLLEFRADAAARDSEGRDAMQTAVTMTNRAEELRSLLGNPEGAQTTAFEQVTGGPDRFNSALSQAARKGQVDALKQLLAWSPNPVEAAQQSLLAACAGGSVEAAEALLEFRADVNTQDQDGNTPLIAAADEGMVKMVRWLTKHRCNPCAASKDGATALMAAAFRGSAEACNLLLASRADPNQEADQGWTALLAACRAGHVEIAKCLLDAGAQLDHKGADGETAQQLAAKNGKREVVKLLDTRIQLDKRRASVRGGTTSQVDGAEEDTRDLDGLLRDLGEAPSSSKKKQARGKKKATATNTEPCETTAVSMKHSTDMPAGAAPPEASSNTVEEQPAETVSVGTSKSRSSKKKAEAKLRGAARMVTADDKSAEAAAEEVADVAIAADVTNAATEVKSLRARLKEIERARADLDAEELGIRRRLDAIAGV